MKTVGKFIGAAITVGAVLLTGGSLGIALLAGGLALAQATILAPKIGGKQERQASETTLQLGEVPRQAIFGRAATAGSLLDGFNYGGEYGTDWEVLVLALADHECTALEGFYVNDDYVGFTGDGSVAGYNGQLQVYFLPGTATQAMPSVVTAQGGWSASDNCKGVACVVVAYKADDPESENPVWPGGRPRFLWVVKGKKCYIPARDDTVTGGSGTHRWNNPSTWEWTDNAEHCRYQFERGIYALDQVDQPDQLVIGRGLSQLEAPPELSIVYAATCAETVPLQGGGSEIRYAFNGIVGADESFLEAETDFADAMAGIIVQPDGGIAVEPGAAKAVSVEITDADILNLAEVEVEEFRGEADGEWVNTVVPRFVDTAKKWTMHSGPVRRVYADVIADGGPRLDNPELKHVTSGTQAQRIGDIRRRLGRLLGQGGLKLGPRFAGLEEGDWIGWTSDRHFGGARKVFRIQSYSRDMGWHMQLRLREIASSAYGWNELADEESDQTLLPSPIVLPPIGPPGENAWSVEAGSIEGVRGVQPALVIAGSRDNGRATAIRLEVRKVGDVDWRLAGDYGANATDLTIPGVADSTGHEVAVSYLVDGEPGERRVLAPATTGDMEGAASWDNITDPSGTKPVDNATRNTGALADKDQVGTSDLEDNAVNLGGSKVTGTLPTTKAAAGLLNDSLAFDFSANKARLKNHLGGVIDEYDLALGGGVDAAAIAESATRKWAAESGADKAAGKGLGFVDSAASSKLGGIDTGATAGENRLFNGELANGAQGWTKNGDVSTGGSNSSFPVPYIAFCPNGGSGQLVAQNRFSWSPRDTYVSLTAFTEAAGQVGQFVINCYDGDGGYLTTFSAPVPHSGSPFWQRPSIFFPASLFPANTAEILPYWQDTNNSGSSHYVGLLKLSSAQDGSTRGARTGAGGNLLDESGATLTDDLVKTDKVRLDFSTPGQIGIYREATGGPVNIDQYNVELGDFDPTRSAKLDGVEAGADVTANAQITFTDVTPYGIQADSSGATTTNLPAAKNINVFRGDAQVTTGVSVGSVTTSPSGAITATASQAGGVVTVSLTKADASGSITVPITVAGITYSKTITVNRTLAAPVSGGGSGSNSFTDQQWDNVSSTTAVQVTDAGAIVQANASGEIEFSASAMYDGSGAATIVAEYRPAAGGSWSTAFSATGTAAVAEDPGPPAVFGEPGFVSGSAIKTGLTANADYEVRLTGRRASGTGVLSWSGPSFVAMQP